MTTTDLLTPLKKYFGYNTFRPHQEEIITSILNGQDTVAILPTGAGKSLCYQLPAILKSGTTVVISPLIALMVDQVSTLRQQGIPAGAIHSGGLGTDQRTEIYREFAQLKLVYVSPERIADDGFKEFLRRQYISMIVIDEAHCISQWGHAFRPEYRQLGTLKDDFSCPITAFTATATPTVISDIGHQLRLNAPQVTISTFERPNLNLSVEPRNGTQKIIDYVTARPGQSGIIYAATRKGVETITDALKKHNINATMYHAGLSDTHRQKAQEQFIKDDIPVMVATLAFGMGINKPDVRYVIHANMPQSIEQYYQEIGRAGRDGLPSDCLTLYSVQDKLLHTQFLSEYAHDSELYHSMKRKLEAMVAYCTATTCRRRDILAYFGQQGNDRCNHCDNCLSPPVLIEGTELAQKILSCVVRVQQRFGIHHVVDVLRGTPNDLIVRHRHDRLSTFNLLPEMSKPALIYYIQALIHLGHLAPTGGQYPVLTITESALAILKKSTTVHFREFTKSERKAKKAKPATGLSDNPSLFQDLKKLRKSLADDSNVPPYIIFSDRTLKEIADTIPKTEAQLIYINGIGPTKLARYGKHLLSVLNRY